MELLQSEPAFEPITLILETRSEAEALLFVMEHWISPKTPAPHQQHTYSKAKHLATEISNAFTNNEVKL